MNTKQIKNGFTLVELLAVIVILGIIMAIGGGITMKVKKNANIEQAKQLENTIEELGPNIYSHEALVGKTNGNYFYTVYKNIKKEDEVTLDEENMKNYQEKSLIITFSELKEAGYLKASTIANPSGNGNCEGFLRVYKTKEGPYFEGNICCAGLYSTNAYQRHIADPEHNKSLEPEYNKDGKEDEEGGVCSWYIKKDNDSGKIVNLTK